MYHLPNQNRALNNTKKSQHYCFVSEIRINVIFQTYHSCCLAVTLRLDIRSLLSESSQLFQSAQYCICHLLSSPKLKAFIQTEKSSRLQTHLIRILNLFLPLQKQCTVDSYFVFYSSPHLTSRL